MRDLAQRKQKHFWGVKMTMVFQDPMTSLNPVQKCGEQIAETLDRMGDDNWTALEKAVDLLEQVGIPEPAKQVNQYPHELSGGLRQRVVIAMALACNHRCLSPTSPPPPSMTVQKRLLDLLDRLRQERGMSMVLITHDLGVARGRCDDVAVMYGGRLVERAPTEVLFSDSRHPYTEALLRTIPRIEQPSHTRLEPIEGRPPELIDPPEQCAFAPRCRHAQAACLEGFRRTRLPGMHEFACFYPSNTERGDEAMAAISPPGRPSPVCDRPACRGGADGRHRTRTVA